MRYAHIMHHNDMIIYHITLLPPNTNNLYVTNVYFVYHNNMAQLYTVTAIDQLYGPFEVNELEQPGLFMIR